MQIRSNAAQKILEQFLSYPGAESIKLLISQPLFTRP
ncbi:uncharacterized protein METZ01_LOCUS463390 [marine metagenome]|uniref:Uncharacterized protein n=1 Tax=marine metagenome TaxID=408172 RepID=A0A383ARI5_9ZZZZ